MFGGGIFQLIAYGARDVYLINTYDGHYTIFDSEDILKKWNYPDNFVPLYKRNKYRLETILDHFDSYLTLLLCVKKIRKDTTHKLWLPKELWNHITNFIRKDIETFNVGINNYKRYRYAEEKYDIYTTLYELFTYKKELYIIKTQHSDKKDDLSKKKFKKKINSRKQKRIDTYKKKIYAY